MAGASDQIIADYIVVGGGSAGCVVANRLSADPKNRVLLLEAGGDDRPLANLSQFRSNMNIYIPAGWAYLGSNPQVDWGYVSEPDPGTNGRTHLLSRGKVLGGSSSTNGLMYVRGFPSDFDGWRQLGCEGWAWEDVRPLFLRSEDFAGGGNEFHGTGGPLGVCTFPETSEVLDAFIEASVQAGLPRSADINGAVQEGVSYAQQTARAGRRQSTAAAFLHPVRRRANLRIETRAQASRVLFEGRRAAGVEYVQNGRTVTARANAEVILCGGAFNSPQLLELSGIGAAARLSALGISVLHDLPAVGENLQDHFTFLISARMKAGSPSVNSLTRGLPFLGQLARYALFRRGLLAGATGGTTGYLRSRPELDVPDVQFFASAATVDGAATMEQQRIVLETEPGITLGGYIMRPASRGTVHVASADPQQKPSIHMNYLREESDRIGTVNALRAVRKLIHVAPMADYIAAELEPLRSIAQDDDAGLLDYARNTGGTAYHQVGTCRMGGDAQSVVDPQLRVRGVEGLRIADASIMPRIVSANTNATCIMIGEKLSDMVLQRSVARAA